MQLGFIDLFFIYRSQGRSLARAIQWAWRYRHFVLDHSESLRYRAEMHRLEALANVEFERHRQNLLSQLP